MISFPRAYFYSNPAQSLFFFGEGPILKCQVGNALHELDKFIAENQNRYLVTFLGYDLKNEIEDLKSENKDFLQFPDLFCWNPAFVISLEKGNAPIYLQGEKSDFSEKEIENWLNELNQPKKELPKIHFKSQISKSDYLGTVKLLQNEIQQGNTYELNFCQTFIAENVPDFKSIELLKQQIELTQAPFSVFLEFDQFQVFCGSPERFIQKAGNKVISEPIKGTIKRGSNLEEDEQLKIQLKSDPKERAENIMIADLVRNDLSRIAQKNSVKVEELCGIHTFETVHHMISTISCELKENLKFSDILKATFPMGSMTGAPKISSMELIEKHESFKRGLYSGSIGYFKPNGDFDFNVVIRSFLYNLENRCLTCSVGGAITIQADAEKEYEECLVKVKRMLQLFGDDQGI
jgi:para-aminobenzoate synthetase component I